MHSSGGLLGRRACGAAFGGCSGPGVVVVCGGPRGCGALGECGAGGGYRGTGSAERRGGGDVELRGDADPGGMRGPWG